MSTSNASIIAILMDCLHPPETAPLTSARQAVSLDILEPLHPVLVALPDHPPKTAPPTLALRQAWLHFLELLHEVHAMLLDPHPPPKTGPLTVALRQAWLGIAELLHEIHKMFLGPHPPQVAPLFAHLAKAARSPGQQDGEVLWTNANRVSATRWTDKPSALRVQGHQTPARSIEVLAIL
eukprot:CAMPEP_0194479696 /NCGR_PEP_ID=MMETSP0253-20130528/2732_1 /TAXON_ID=2966 /ORGANISM="Noctiluca scintillans" /LENGTH=179 /DNA_ID=CAMNT_0039318963 /DNA_START=192 /DNA_END=732 /DNA_ORIENTATION=-